MGNLSQLTVRLASSHRAHSLIVDSSSSALNLDGLGSHPQTHDNFCQSVEVWPWKWASQKGFGRLDTCLRLDYEDKIGKFVRVEKPTTEQYGGADQALLHCPVRGKLNASALAKDGLTPTEEARRIDFINYLLRRKFPKTHISVETVVLKGLGEKGRNRLRADVIVYDIPVTRARRLDQEDQLDHAVLVAEIKRDSIKKASGISCQLEPAMRQLPGMRVLGVYWDDLNRILFTKLLRKKGNDTFLEITQDNLANLPAFGTAYKVKLITVDTLTPPENLVSTLFNLANIMRSHGVNDEQLRYKETVKLILARYCDEKAALASSDKEVQLQVYPGGDPRFRKRIDSIYTVASKRYSRARTLFKPFAISELDDHTLRDIVKAVQGVNFSSASSETMQQVFMSFVPTVFKKNLDQYFTPITLIRAMVEMTRIGPNEKVADPAMGTADFLTAAMDYRVGLGDSDIIQRVFGVDSDAKAFELAIINMILNRDGQANLINSDSLAEDDMWAEEMGVTLCNPPFGARTIESRPEVLEKYDLGHVWEYRLGQWRKSSEILQPYQQLGILFIERCWKLLADNGRIAIILPEGYLCTSSYGYVRQWLLDHFQVLSLVELPRRIFLKSEADLRSNIFIGKKLPTRELRVAKRTDYPIHCDLVRNVGYKLGTGFQPIPKREQKSGLEVRDDQNRLLLESDFDRVRLGFSNFISKSKDPNWNGARFK